MSKKTTSPFEALKGLKVKQEPAYPRRAAPPPPPPEPPAEPDEDELFSSAMRGVKPIHEGTAGRDVPPQPEIPPPPAPAPDDDARALSSFLRGEIEFELEFTEEYMRGFVRGLDPRDFQKLKAGALSTEAHLDMHGLNAEQAYDALLFFLRESYLQGKRCVLLIPGRGLGSPGGYSVLRAELRAWLTREPLRRIVLAFCTALPRDGGAGALYVLLRKKRKDQGKVQWDRLSGSDWDE
ncbi:MAG: Smr/MutS family protein [Desulfovibrionaceae bacterium]